MNSKENVEGIKNIPNALDISIRKKVYKAFFFLSFYNKLDESSDDR